MAITDVKIEITAYEIVVKELKAAISRIQKRVDREIAKWEKSVQHAAGYESFEDAQNAYGYDEITLDELDNIGRIFNDEGMPETACIHAVKLLCNDLNSYKQDLDDMKLHAMTEKQRAAELVRRRRAALDWKQKKAEIHALAKGEKEAGHD